MKKFSCLFILSALISVTYAQSYKSALQKVNTFLKTFDDGYYGHLEIKDGVLYDYYKSGKYSKMNMSDFSSVKEESSMKVVIYCMYDEDCVYSTYTDSYHKQLSFSQSTNFNTDELVTLFENLKKAYNGSSSSTEKNNKPENSKQTIASALAKANAYLKTFDNNYYGYLDVKDGMLYDYYKSGKYSKMSMSDFSTVKEESDKKVVIYCAEDGDCVYSTYTDSYHKELSFSQSNNFNTQELITLLENIKIAYDGSSSSKDKTTQNNSGTLSNSSNQTRNQKAAERQKTNSKSSDFDVNEYIDEVRETGNKYDDALSKLNKYLKTFNPETYSDVKVIEGSVYFNFKVNNKPYYTSITIPDLTQKTTISKVNSYGTEEIKIMSKGDAKYFFSTYSNQNMDHFRFYSNTLTDLNTIKQLVVDFISALK